MLSQELVSNLEEQVLLHQELLGCAAAEQALTPKCPLKDLQALHLTRDQTVISIKAKENRRIQVIEELAAQHNLGSDVTLRQIQEVEETTVSDRLGELRSQLLELTSDLQNLSKGAAQKAVARNNAINEFQKNLDRTLQRPSLYGMNGKTRKTTGAVFFSKSI